MRRGGSAVRVTALITASVAAPSATRTSATPTGVNDVSPTSISANEKPQNSASSRKGGTHVRGGASVEALTRRSPGSARPPAGPA